MVLFRDMARMAEMRQAENAAYPAVCAQPPRFTRRGGLPRLPGARFLCKSTQPDRAGLHLPCLR